MRLLIISHTPHYLDGQTIKGWGATVREIDQLAELFDEVVHIAPLYNNEMPTATALEYHSPKIRLQPVDPSGGEGIISKLGILLEFPVYASHIMKEIRRADIVHVRCPSNISLLAIFILAFIRNPRKRWIKYAGNWQPTGKEALSYTVQRWWLKKNLSRAKVTINGRWTEQPSHISSFFNPCLTDDEVKQGVRVAAEKSIIDSLRLVFVGRLETAKGVGRILEIIRELRDVGCSVQIDLIGDGSERTAFEALCSDNQLEKSVHFHGWLSRAELNEYYAKAHIILLPSSSEGWPKVLSEAMAYGVVPVSSDIGSIPQLLQDFDTGRAIEVNELQAFVDALRWYGSHIDEWKRESQNSVKAAAVFSYRYYLGAVKQLLELP